MNPPLIIQPILILLGGAALTPVASIVGRAFKAERVREIVCILALALSFYTLLFLYHDIQALGPAKYIFAGFPALNGGVELYVDLLSIYFAWLFTGLGLLVAVYSTRYMEKDTGQDSYYTLLLTLVAGMVGVAFSGDFFNLFVFWEMMCVSSYALVSFRKHLWEPVEAGFKYLIMSTLGSLMILYGVSIFYGMTGTVNFRLIRSALIAQGGVSPITLYLLIAVIVAGFGVTAAIVPLHTWLPDAHPAAPSSISAMLSGVVIKAGVYGVGRSMFTLFNPTTFNYGALLMVFGVLTLTVGNFMALLQSDIKRLLAYSSVVNIGYIITGLGIGGYVITKYYSVEPRAALGVAALAATGGLFHVFNHALGKGLLFLCSGCFLHEAKTRDISALEGVGRRMKWTGASLSIGLFSLAGIPPFSGFWSKLLIILGGLGIPGDGFLSTITTLVVLNSVFSASYYLWLVQRILVKKPTSGLDAVKEAPIPMVAPIVLLAALIILVGLTPGPMISLVESVSRTLLGGW